MPFQRPITPIRLARILDSFRRGDFREAGPLFEHIERRDDQVAAVVRKRKRSVSLLDWKVLTTEDSEEAEAHKAALEACYNNLVTSHFRNPHERGGFALLRRQMMDAVGQGFAVHELVWEPVGEERDGYQQVTFRALQVPLQQFEAKDGPLKRLTQPTDRAGQPLEEHGWLVAAGEGLMEATAIAYLYKQMAVRGWAAFTEKYGFPLVHARTDAPADSAEWAAFADALTDLGQDAKILTSTAADLSFHTIGAAGDSPHAPLVERMDRAIAILWRGGDLSTMGSAQVHTGATVQAGEQAMLLADDAALLSETLNQQVDRAIASQVFGVERLKAYVKILPPQTILLDEELKRLKVAQEAGIPLAVNDIRERLGLRKPSPGEELIYTQSSAMDEKTAELSASNSATATLPEPPKARGTSSPVDMDDEDWFRLATWGDAPHAVGLQRIDRRAADTLVESFSPLVEDSLSFGEPAEVTSWSDSQNTPAISQVPVYLGHPDDAQFCHVDRDHTVYGEVTALKHADDGLYARIRWSSSYANLQKRAPWRLSPRWLLQPIENSVFRPVRLLSVGLTKTPNLPHAAWVGSEGEPLSQANQVGVEASVIADTQVTVEKPQRENETFLKTTPVYAVAAPFAQKSPHRDSESSLSPLEQFRQLVEEEMPRHSGNYTAAWTAARRSPQGQSLYKKIS